MKEKGITKSTKAAQQKAFSSFIQLAQKNTVGTNFLQIFKTTFLVRTLISQPNMNEIKNESKKNRMLEIKDLVFMSSSIKQRAFFDIPGSYDNGSTTNTTI